MNISVYQKFIKKIARKNIFDILSEIKSNKYEKEIKSIRNAISVNDFSVVDKLKKNLVAFTPSATFNNSRTIDEIGELSNIICIDYDDLPVTEIVYLCSKINSSKFTFSSFISPSGNGIKVFVKVKNTIEKHLLNYIEISNYYNTLIGFENDKKCKDITRLCFVSFDNNIYINMNSIEFKTSNEKYEKLLSTSDLEVELDLLDYCLKFTEKIETYYKGNRNNFIYLFSCNANRLGVNENDTYEYCITNFDLAEKEIKTIVHNVYKLQSLDFAKFANYKFSVDQIDEKQVELDYNEDYLLNTPCIPNEVYNNLPQILKESTQLFSQQREKDTFLTGAITILSGCLPNVSGLYGGSKVYPNLYSFILAPAASGKGALKHAQNLASVYHESVLENSKHQKRIYEKELTAYKLAKNKIENANIEMPEEPKFKVVLIPANTSNSKVIQHLEINDGNGIICETEADTMGQTFKNEWGSYSDMLRKAFHHERISISRKTNSEYIEIEEPKLSVALSGTLNQILSIISSAEDGLFSRFIYYVFKPKSVWIDASPTNNPVNLTDFFNEKSKEVFAMVNYFENYPSTFTLTLEQWDKHKRYFEQLIYKINIFISEDADSMVKRLGLILYRISMILSALRKFEQQNYDSKITCLDIDFDTALLLIKIYVEHSVLVFNNLPKNNSNIRFNLGNNRQKFFDALPNEFTRKEAVKIGSEYKLSARTIDNFLKCSIGIYLDQSSFGNYEKIQKKITE